MLVERRYYDPQTIPRKRSTAAEALLFCGLQELTHKFAIAKYLPSREPIESLKKKRQVNKAKGRTNRLLFAQMSRKIADIFASHIL